MTAGFPIPPGRVEKPALQKAETEWKAEKKSSSCKVIPSVPCTLNQITAIPIPSIASVKPNIYNKVESNEFRELELIMSPTIN
ncbi:unknown [Phocaeicola plebeius CAG:211]|uniref:Uncharacterized protein n=1 Tax=Phocaeicola plebeius CAG:211 TaxID=1263052 RepID=R5VK81_9BACT|nr:unknown [Phocaeicola plebeius CAG:211]